MPPPPRRHKPTTSAFSGKSVGAKSRRQARRSEPNQPRITQFLTRHRQQPPLETLTLAGHRRQMKFEEELNKAIEQIGTRERDLRLSIITFNIRPNQYARRFNVRNFIELNWTDGLVPRKPQPFFWQDELYFYCKFTTILERDCFHDWVMMNEGCHYVASLILKPVLASVAGHQTLDAELNDWAFYRRKPLQLVVELQDTHPPVSEIKMLIQRLIQLSRPRR